MYMYIFIYLYVRQAPADDAFRPSRRCAATKGPGFSFPGPQGGPFRESVGGQRLSYIYIYTYLL